MRAMKDSGIEWIGEIPESWETIKIKYLFSINSGESISKEEFVLDASYPVIGANGEIGRTNKYNNERNIITTGRVGTIGTTHIFGKSWITDNVLRLFSKTKDNLKYYCFTIPFFDFKEMTSGTAMPLITSTKLYNQFVPFLPIDEQERIAEFLDKKCGEIDEVIAKTEKTIEEYKALKQSVITEAVTKGIRPNRPMKDSGIEWIGQIPEEWELIPFRHVLFERNEKNNPIISTERLSLSIDLGVTLYAEKTTNLDRFKDDFTQYKIARKGDLVMNSMNMIVGASGVSNWLGCVSPVYYTFYDNEHDHITAKYCEYIFRSKTMLRVLYSLGKGIYAIERGDDRVNTCRLKVSKEDLKSIIIPIPNVNEQREIVNYISSKCTEIDKLIEAKRQLLTELGTYKKSVIYEYVTGKKEVH